MFLLFLNFLPLKVLSVSEIGQLWLTYSDKRFGFNEQQQIYGKTIDTMTPAQRENDAAN